MAAGSVERGGRGLHRSQGPKAPSEGSGRAGRTRTGGLLLPKQARCQTAPQPGDHLIVARPPPISVSPAAYLAAMETMLDLHAWRRISPADRRELGRLLRGRGLSYGEIQQVIPVPQGTLAGWCRGIQLSPAQQQRIKARRPPGSRSGRPVDTQRKRRLQIEKLRKEAAAEVDQLISDPLWVAGVVLYWAEGEKTMRRLGVTNGDPAALRLFIAWVRRFHRPDAEFVLALHLHGVEEDGPSRDYWAAQLGLEGARFNKSFIKPVGTGHRKNKLKHGVCRVLMSRSTDAFIRTQVWIEEVSRRLAGPG